MCAQHLIGTQNLIFNKKKALKPAGVSANGAK
jgi:hypothetical protein